MNKAEKQESREEEKEESQGEKNPEENGEKEEIVDNEEEEKIFREEKFRGDKASEKIKKSLEELSSQNNFSNGEIKYRHFKGAPILIIIDKQSETGTIKDACVGSVLEYSQQKLNKEPESYLEEQFKMHLRYDTNLAKLVEIHQADAAGQIANSAQLERLRGFIPDQLFKPMGRLMGVVINILNLHCYLKGWWKEF